MGVFHRIFRHAKGNLVSRQDRFAYLTRLLSHVEVTGIIDVGASDGKLSRRFLGLFPRATVYAFDPQPCFAKPLRDYAVDEPRFKCFLAAVCDRTGEVDLHMTVKRGSVSMLARCPDAASRLAAAMSPTGTIKVPAVTLDDWSTQQGDPPIQLVKLDIQQGELMALRGATRVLRSVHAVLTEVFFNPRYEGGALFGDIDAFLRQGGFELFNIYKPRDEPTGQLLWADAIFVRPALLRAT